MSSSLVGTLALFTAALLYGSQNIATRIAGISFGPFLSTSLRALVVVLALIWFVKWKRVENKHWKWFILRALGNVIATTGIFVAVNKMSVGAALFSFYAGLILSGGIFGVLFYKEKITAVKIVSLVLTAIGLLFIYSYQSALVFNWYFIIAIIGGIGGSLWSVFSRPISKTYSLPQLVVLDSLMVVFMAAIISFFLRESWQTIQIDTRLAGVFYLGLTQVFTGQLVARGFKTVDAQVGSMILLNDSVVGMVLAFIIFHETAPLMVIVGGVCVFLSTIIPVVLEHKKK